MDTTAFSDLMREHPRMDAHMAALSSGDRLVVCSIVRGEIRYGIERLPQGRRRRELEEKALGLFTVVPCESIPEAAADHYARIKWTRQQTGLSLDENDLWIAATSVALGAVLVSRDSDFQEIEGLTVQDWTAQRMEAGDQPG